MKTKQFDKFKPWIISFNVILLLIGLYFAIISWFDAENESYARFFFLLLSTIICVAFIIIQVLLFSGILLFGKKTGLKQDIISVLKTVFIINLITIGLFLFSSNTSGNYNRKKLQAIEAERSKLNHQIDSLTTLISKDKTKALLFQRAYCYRKTGNFDKSSSDLFEITLIDSLDYIAFFELAWNMMAITNYEKALDYYRAAYNIDSSETYIGEQIKWLENRINPKQDSL